MEVGSIFLIFFVFSSGCIVEQDEAGHFTTFSRKSHEEEIWGMQGMQLCPVQAQKFGGCTVIFLKPKNMIKELCQDELEL